MKNLLAMVLFAFTTLAQAATYDLVTLTNNSGQDATNVYHLQVVVDENHNIKQLSMPAINPDTHCPIHLLPRLSSSESVTVKYEAFQKLSDGTCVHSGRALLNLGIYDPQLLKAAGPRLNNVIPLWFEYLVNGINMTRSEKIDLILAYNSQKRKWQIWDKTTERVVSNIKFLVNKMGPINIGVAKHVYSFAN